jgi:hypothetical protein
MSTVTSVELGPNEILKVKGSSTLETVFMASERHQKKTRGKQTQLPKWHICENTKRCTVYEYKLHVFCTVHCDIII